VEPSNLAIKLQKTADYRTVLKSLKTAGIWSILFGAIALVLGMVAPSIWVLSALGLVLVGTGVWNIVAPRPAGIIVDGVTLLMVGAYSLVFTVLAVTQGGGASAHWAVLGVTQLVWGAGRIGSYRRYASAFLEQPSDAELQQLDQAVDAVRNARPKETSGVIQIAVDGLHRSVWKAKLTGDDAIFVEVTGHDVVIGTRESVEIENRGRVMIGSAVKVTVSVDGHELKGTMPAAAWRLYEQWKTGIVMPKAIAA